MITCVVPVFNDERTIAGVLDVATSVAAIDEVLAVDDGSRDGSARVLAGYRHPKCRVLSHPRNRGKAAAVVTGIEAARGDVIMVCDADLRSLRPHHLTALIERFAAGDAGMVIAAREGADGWFDRLNARLAGERIFRKRDVEPFCAFAPTLGHGWEQLLNYIYRHQKIVTVVSRDIGHFEKFRRYPFPLWLFRYVTQYHQFPLATLRIALVLRRRSLLASVRRLSIGRFSSA